MAKKEAKSGLNTSMTENFIPDTIDTILHFHLKLLIETSAIKACKTACQTDKFKKMLNQWPSV